MTPTRSHRRSLLLLVLLSVALALLAMEGGARAFGRLTHRGRGMTFDTELGWRPLRHVRKIGTVWGVSRPASTNSHGWRDPEHSFEKPSGVQRAVVIGDSFTFGTDVDDGERFTDVLGRRVDRLEVINLGVPGYGTDQQLRLLETEAFRYQPDVVILTVCVFNDLDDIGYERLYSWPKPHYSLEDGRLRLWKPTRTWEISARESSLVIELLYQRLVSEDRKRRRAPGFVPADALPLFDALVRQIAETTNQHGVQLVAVLAYAPEGMGGDFADAGRRIAAALNGAGVPTLDTRKLFAARSSDPNRELYSPIGFHWNARGHSIVAEGIQQLLHSVGVN